MLDAFKSVYIYRNLILQLVRRDIAARYQGALIGASWSLIFPLLSLAVYGFVFGVILKPRWPGIEDSLQFTLILFSGLLVFNFFSECLSRAPSLMVANSNFVKKVVFPIDILIWVPIVAALYHLMLGMIAWFLLCLAVGQGISWTFFLFPFAITPLVFIVAGFSWLLSALGVYVRDVGQVIGVAMQMLLYLGPIIYPREALPEDFRWAMLINPLTVPVEQFRNVVNFGTSLDWLQIAIFWLVSLVVFLSGKLFFDKCRHGFADVV